MTTLTDSLARERAATIMDRNLVMTAGAGTGKTTLLVDRLTHLLFRQPDPVAIGEIVALTFTNKAANEMKLRLRERLSLWQSLDPGRPPPAPAHQRDWEQMNDVLARYTLSKGRMNELAGKALRELEKSQIGTIHSFAAHLLRLHPRESGVDPAFTEDDGSQFAEHLEREWTLWLDEELGPRGSRHVIWREALGAVSLEDIKSLAVQLCSELIPLEEVMTQLRNGAPVPPVIRAWLGALADRAAHLREGRPKITIIERMLEAASKCLGELAEGRRAVGDSTGTEEIDRDPPSKKTNAWSTDDYVEAKRLLRTARTVLYLDAGPLNALLPSLSEFAGTCRRRFIERGLVSFDGLLARARDLLRDHPAIRRTLKTQFRALLVDEFQDTDPVQYELILYLAEVDGTEARRWQDLRLKPGKLFVVGDPKQSIYAFRRADMEAYDAVVEELVLEQGDREALQTNFRSHGALLEPINACFTRLFPVVAIKGLQPKDEPLVPAESAVPSLPEEGVEIRLVRPETEEADADTATRCEAEALARWLREDVLDRQHVREGALAVAVKPRHVAILFRTLTHARDYLEALRRYEIPYLTEGEKHFYERQEIIDMVNLLRASAEPHDQIALVGVIRSPLGGLTDRDVERLARTQRLDFRLDPGREVEAAVPIYALLRDFQRRLPTLTVAGAVEEVFTRAPLMELAAASLDGEQAMANLRKLRNLLVDLAGRADVSWHGLIRTLTERVADPPDETESPLAEEGPEDPRRDGAVRVLSIHKAKGLEFPIVVLAGLHRGKDGRRDRVFVKHDWSTGLVGVRAGEAQTLAGVYLDAKLAEREQAEQRRVLYVAMTRPRRRLILSAGIPSKTNRLGDSFLALVSGGFGVDLLDHTITTVQAGDREIPLAVVEGREVPLTRSGHESNWMESSEDLSVQLSLWEGRARRWREAGAATMFRTPARILDEANVPHSMITRLRPGEDEDRARHLGMLVHRVLESWDFTGDLGQLDECLNATGGGLPPEVRGEVGDILSVFVATKLYAELRRAVILGREVPFLMPWEGNGQWALGNEQDASQACPEPGRRVTRHSSLSVMEGVIDLLYELDGHLWVADYKTDRITGDQGEVEAEVQAKAEIYRAQLEIYRQAVEKALDMPRVRAQIIFLRLGRAVEV